jgi:hypothetical protein
MPTVVDLLGAGEVSSKFPVDHGLNKDASTIHRCFLSRGGNCLGFPTANLRVHLDLLQKMLGDIGFRWRSGERFRDNLLAFFRGQDVLANHFAVLDAVFFERFEACWASPRATLLVFNALLNCRES